MQLKKFVMISLCFFYQFGSVWQYWSEGCRFMSGFLEQDPGPGDCRSTKARKPWRSTMVLAGVCHCICYLAASLLGQVTCMQHMHLKVWDFFLLIIILSFTLASTQNWTVKSYQVITGENQGLSLILILTAVPNSSMLSSWFLLIDKPTLVEEITFYTHTFMLLWAFNQS